MIDLFGLPLEIRQMIYAKCLVVGKCFPYTIAGSLDENECNDDDSLKTIESPLESSGYGRPNNSLLRACKVIHQEAEPLLYQCNTFVLPISDLTARLSQGHAQVCGDAFRGCGHDEGR